MYEDLNSKYFNTNTAENQVPTTANIESVKKGLERLLTTPKGHNPFNRNYGSSLYDLLFQNNLSAPDVQMFLYMDITNWEPRLDISPSDITVTMIDRNTYQVNCKFSLNGYNSEISTFISKE